MFKVTVPGQQQDAIKDPGTSLWNASVRIVSTETVPKVLLDISVLYGLTPSSLPSLRGHSVARQTTPLHLFSSNSPVHYVDTS